MLVGSLQLRCEMRERALTGTIDDLPPDRTKNNQYTFINASGGVIAYVSPQVTFSLLGDWSLTLQYNFPFYKNVYGAEQLTNRHSMMASISRNIDFSGGDDSPEFDLESSLLSVEVPVRGNCDMCRERIEGVAAKREGVRAAHWNEDTKILTVFYKGEKPDIAALESALAKAGHDTDHYTAPDNIYSDLPACCQYR
jgi:hypothetical protein